MLQCFHQNMGDPCRIKFCTSADRTCSTQHGSKAYFMSRGTLAPLPVLQWELFALLSLSRASPWAVDVPGVVCREIALSTPGEAAWLWSPVSTPPLSGRACFAQSMVKFLQLSKGNLLTFILHTYPRCSFVVLWINFEIRISWSLLLSVTAGR